MSAALQKQQPTAIRSICVLAGGETGNDTTLLRAAQRLGVEIAGAGIRLVYGGGSGGVSGAVAKGAAAANGQVIAIAPNFLLEGMRHCAGVHQVIAVPDLHARKRLMFDYADAFVALPGGIGTIEAMAELMAWRELKQHKKPLLLANITGLWSPWLNMLGQLEASGFVSGETSQGILVADEVTDILPRLRDAIRNDNRSEWLSYAEAIEDAGGCYSPPNP